MARTLGKVVVFVLLVVLSSPVSAKELLLQSPTSSLPLLELPEGTRLKLNQGTFQGYTLEEFKTVLKIYTDYRSFGQQIPLYQQNVLDLTEAQGALKQKVSSLELDNEKLTAELERKHKMWLEENEKRHIAENKPQFGSWIAWGIAGVATVAVAVLTGVLITR